jgi:hypothetical protein
VYLPAEQTGRPALRGGGRGGRVLPGRLHPTKPACAGPPLKGRKEGFTIVLYHGGRGAWRLEVGQCPARKRCGCESVADTQRRRLSIRRAAQEALCIAGVDLRRTPHVLPCSRKLMRSATDLHRGFQRGLQAPWPWVQHFAAEATAACGGNREQEQGQRSKFSSDAPRRDKNFGNRNPLIAGGLFCRFWAAPKATPGRGYQAGACETCSASVKHQPIH